MRAATSGRRALISICGAVALALPRAAPAAPDGRRVVVLRSPDDDDVMREVATRTQAELTASGVSATIVECESGAAACRPVVARTGGDTAIRIATYRENGQVVTEVSAAPAAPRIVRADGAQADAKVFAIRAVELVRAALLEPPPSPPATVVAEPAHPLPSPTPAPPAAAPPARRRWAVGVGGTWLESVDGLGGAYGLTVRAEYLTRRELGLAVLVSGPDVGAAVQADRGTVSIRQELAALQLTWRPRRTARLEPRLAAGMGAYHLVARGAPAGAADVVGRSDSMWALLVAAGAGAILAIGDQLGVFADVQALLTSPQPAVDRGTNLARGGNPSIFLSLGVQRTF